MLKINDNFHITRDSDNWILHKTWQVTSKSGKRKGEIITKERMWYFGTLSQLVHHTVDLGLDATEDMEKLKESLHVVHRDLSKLLKAHSLHMRQLMGGKI